MFSIRGKYGDITVMIDDVEESCMSQLYAIANHPAFTGKKVVMPDVHAGKGNSVVGFSMTLDPDNLSVCPNTVGVDIGCSLLSYLFNTPHDWHKVNQWIKSNVFFGRKTNLTRVYDRYVSFETFLKETHRAYVEFAHRYFSYAKVSYPIQTIDRGWFQTKCVVWGVHEGYALNSIGTVGGGNHFIEIGQSQQKPGNYYLTIHTGSRNLGKCVCEYWQRVAVDSMKCNDPSQLQREIQEIRDTCVDRASIPLKIQEVRNRLGHQVPKGMEYLIGEDLFGYLTDMFFAQSYATFNRRIIASVITEGALHDFDGYASISERSIETTHNYIDFNDFVIRKGAVRAYKGEKLIIPFNMKDGLWICEGKSNPDWNNTAPHGAGRCMSRSDAKRTIALADVVAEMKGVVSSSLTQYSVDESPQAYKNPSVIKACIEPTVVMLEDVRPLLNVKDAGGDN